MNSASLAFPFFATLRELEARFAQNRKEWKDVRRRDRTILLLDLSVKLAEDYKPKFAALSWTQSSLSKF